MVCCWPQSQTVDFKYHICAYLSGSKQLQVWFTTEADNQLSVDGRYVKMQGMEVGGHSKKNQGT